MSQLALGSRVEPRLLSTVAAAAALTSATAAGWLALTRRMAGMDGGPGGDPGALGWFAVTWVAMTAAMMAPAAAPALMRLVRARRGRVSADVVLFLAGYGGVWMLVGLAGYALVEGVRGLHVHALAWSSAGRYVAGAAVAAAGLYQLTDVKRRWLARCTALADATLPRDGVLGALSAGVEHGRCCVACCWTLMAALYALGMMSVAWTVLLTVLIAGERMLARRQRHVVHAVAAVLIVLGIGMALCPRS